MNARDSCSAFRRRLVLLSLLVLFSPGCLASTVYMLTVGGASMLATGLDCASVGDAVGRWYVSTRNRSSTAPPSWEVVSCSFDSSGAATNVSVAVFSDGVSSYQGGPVVKVATDFWFDDPVDPTIFAAWFAFTFVSTISFYFIVVGIGWVLSFLKPPKLRL